MVDRTPPDGLSLRPAEADDAEALSECWIEFGRYYADESPDRFRVPAREGLSGWIAREIEQSRLRDELWLVAEKDETIVGFIRAAIWAPAPDADRQIMREVSEPLLKINSLFVDAAARRTGVGTALMDAATDWGRERGATQAVVIAFAGDEPAVSFYEARMRYERNTIGFWRRL